MPAAETGDQTELERFELGDHIGFLHSPIAEATDHDGRLPLMRSAIRNPQPDTRPPRPNQQRTMRNGATLVAIAALGTVTTGMMGR